MNRWAKIVMTLAALATSGWVAAGALGFRVRDDSSLALHTLVSFSALLALVLLHSWVAVFAAWSAIGLRPFAPRGAAAAVELRRIARRTLVASAAAVLVGGAQFVVSNLLYPAHLSPSAHGFAGAASAIVFALVLVVEARALAAHGRIALGLASAASEQL